MCPITKGKRKILWQFECKEQWIPETDNRFMFSVLAVMGFAVNCHFVSLLPWHIAVNPLKLSQLLNRESKNSLFFEERVSLWKTISQWLFQKISRWSYRKKHDLYYIATTVIYAHMQQFSGSVAPGHSLYWVVQVRPQSSTCPVQPSWHLMNYLYSSHWSTLESYSSNSQLFCSMFLVLWKMLQLLTFR